MPLEWAICLRYLRSARVEGTLSFITWISVIGVALGVGALIVAMAVMNGYRVNLVRAMSGALPHLSVFPRGIEDAAGREALETLLRRQLSIESLTPFLLEEILVRGAPNAPESIRGIMLRGIDPGAESGVPEFAAFFDDGSEEWKGLSPEERARRAAALIENLDVLEAGGAVPVFISRALAAKLGVGIGGILHPLALPGEGGGFSPLPMNRLLVVRGYLETGISTFDDLVAVTAIPHILDLIGNTAVNVSVGVRLTDPLAALGAASTLRQALREGDMDWSVYSWLESNAGLFQVIALQKFMLFLILMLIVVIAVFGMVSALIMLVAEKNKEIAVLSALGMSGARIRQVFMLQGMVIGAVGTAGGLALGLAICWALAAFPLIDIPAGVYPGSDRIPVQVSGWDVLWVTGGTLLISLFATLYPSRKAVTAHPVDGLRYR